MFFDGIAYADLPESGASSQKQNAIGAVIRFLEGKLGVTVLYDRRKYAYGRADMAEILLLAEEMTNRGILSGFSPIPGLSDEPPFKFWAANFSDVPGHVAGGMSVSSDIEALTSALAEAMERYIRYEEKDYFSGALRSTVKNIASRGPYIPPERFAAFSDTERKKRDDRVLRADAEYLWIRGTSLVSGKSTYVPAQTVSAIPNIRRWSAPQEPIIRESNTIGLATWPTRTGARLAGALEILEREAYMVMWLNQLTLPRISLRSLKENSPRLREMIERCEKYRLRPHVVKLLTDAPTHAACVILEDASGVPPRFALGLSAHRSLTHAVEKALLEALRARTYLRLKPDGSDWIPGAPLEKIGHHDRLHYWAHPSNAPKLEFLIQGKEEVPKDASWEKDTIEEHLERIVSWCVSKSFECVSVLLISTKNPTPWQIEMIIMPDLQPTYLSEASQQTGGSRWRDIPTAFGITARNVPFLEEPHPFC
jgi:ribosomal protein S12 methylthiotransferase accessory factor